MTAASERILAVLRDIPAGTVMSYGEVAMLADCPGAARQVARLLHSCGTTHRLPWHRVVRGDRSIALHDPEGCAVQAALLRAEGWSVDAAGRITR